MRQLTLDFSDARTKTLNERFEDWLVECPEVFAAFCRVARMLRDRGERRLGAKRIFELLRVDPTLSGRDRNGLKCNNQFSSRAARRLCEIEPSMRDAFEFRALKSREE